MNILEINIQFFYFIFAAHKTTHIVISSYQRKIHLKNEIFGHKRMKKNKKSWKTISNTLSINYINTLMTDGYMILDKFKRTIQIKQDITKHNNQNYIDIMVSKIA